jgi:hypothetical protein
MILKFEERQTRNFAVGIDVMNGKGISIGRKNFESDDPAELAEWYERNCFKPGKKKKKTSFDEKSNS